ncbi:efflux RND transporter periplasmic adaptor subunit [Cupriavidus sp. 30B13]|uniref:efflux RND transporter periplasmic adaptor subunit n=1 Tax=Cupriavidus sp. 30B13 TaxID=3384241 RepID=UPI003B902089
MNKNIGGEQAAQPGPRGPSRQRRVIAWAALGVAVLAALAWFVHVRQASRGGRPPPPPVAVVAATAQTGDINVNIDALGTVTSLATVTVMSQINGQLLHIGFQEGKIVKKGDFLAQIDPRPFEVALKKDLGQLAHDVAALDGGRVDLDRFARLVKQDSIARQQYDDQLSTVRQLEGTVQADQGQVDSDRLNLAYCHIVSPVTGLVGIRQVDEGNYIQTTNTNGIVVITELQPISVLFTIAEDQLPEVWRRFHQGTPLPVEAYDRDGSKLLATGTLASTDSQINTSTGTVQLRAMFDNPDLGLFPNQFVNVRLRVDVLHDALNVPTAAIQHGTPGAYVYVVSPADTVAVRPVRLGPVDGERVAVLAGLKAGDKVVVDGADKLRDGARVILPGSRPAAERAR